MNINSNHDSTSSYTTKKSRYNACATAKKALPVNAAKYAAVVNNLSINCSPRKRTALKQIQQHGCAKKILLQKKKENVLCVQQKNSTKVL